MIRNIDRPVEFLDLVTACHPSVAAAGHVVPGLRDRQLGKDERTIVHENVARVRATLDWIEAAVETAKVDIAPSLREGSCRGDAAIPPTPGTTSGH